MKDTRTESLIGITKAKVPSDTQVLRSVTVGIDQLTSFYNLYYLEDFVAKGGSVVRFVTGKHGSGKTHFISLLKADAADCGYVTAALDAGKLLLNDFTKLYEAVFKACDFRKLVDDVCSKMLSDLGYQGINLDSGISVMDQISDMGQLDAISRNEIRGKIRSLSINNTYMDNNFAIIVSMFVSARIGLFEFEKTAEERLLMWLAADGSLKLSDIKQDGLLPYRINKYNARHLLRSLTELCRIAGHKGLFISVDNLDVLLNDSALSEVHYTKMRRDDTFESIRQMIDDVDTFRNLFIVFAFNSELLDNDRAGIKSYQALWLRMQNEIVSARFNPFSSLIDMDEANNEYLNAANLIEMSRKFASIANGLDFHIDPIDGSKVEEIIKNAKYGSNALPYLVNIATLGLVPGNNSQN
ncbi:MAG TPA: hypothetical protein DCP98_02945 [Sphaerochaeta sp.]|nr:hypothetical protein [Sphaerochaeta sp.]